jgi:thiamine kinase-like enzyme
MDREGAVGAGDLIARAHRRSLDAAMNDNLGDLVEIRAALGRAPMFAGSPLGPIAAERLASVTNRVFRVTVGGTSYVLRLAGGATRHTIDRAAEVENARAAAAIGLAPPILFADPGEGTMLTAYIGNAVTLDRRQLAEPEILRQAVLALLRLHRSRLRLRGEMRLFPTLDRYWALATAKGAPPGSDLVRARSLAEPLRAAIADLETTLVPSHIDPSPGNMLLLPAGVLLIDWEYSGMAAPFWDLAILSIEASFDRDQDTAMLAAHDGDATAARRERLALYKACLALLTAAWGQAQIALGAGGVDYASFTKERTELALRLLSSNVS